MSDEENYIPVTLDNFQKQISGLPDGYDDLYVSTVCSVLNQILSKLKDNGSVSLEDAMKIIDWRTCDMLEYWQGEYIAN